MGSHAAAEDPDPAFDGAGETMFALTPREHRRLADVLLKAERDQTPIVPLTSRYPELTIADARRIRDLAIGSRVAGGETIIGAKISLARTEKNAGDSDTEPRLGWLTEGMLLDSQTIGLTGLIRPRVQPKVALRLRRPLDKPLATLAELAESIDGVLPCLELVDTRYASCSSEPVDEIADNCAAAGLVLGGGILTPPELALRRLRIEVRIESGGGEASWRSPGPCSLESALWLANRVIEEGPGLEAGGLLVSAGCGPSMELHSEGRVRADFGTLGSVVVHASGGETV
jgi:2-keto-4-pentenoate hydratase